jgi:hypothetical protein
MGLTMEKVLTFLAYWLAVGLAYFGAMTPQQAALYIGSGAAIFTALVNWWYRRKTYLWLKAAGLDKEVVRGLSR